MRLRALIVTLAELLIVGVLFTSLTAADDVSNAQPKPHNPLPKNQQEGLCEYDESGSLWCASPGTGICWAKGHDPYLDEPPAVVDVGNPESPNYEHGELCADPDRRKTVK
jgi:hypothetical protein